MKISRLFCLMLIFCTGNYAVADENYIVVEKKGVVHKFVPFDRATDYFTSIVFHNWENETFDVFDKVKANEGIAIDIGAWIGTTAIWLSKNFHHVVSVEADNISLQCLQKNLTASECFNVSVCDKPILDTTRDVIFGPRGNVLNESISYIKDVSDNEKDYVKKSITFKQMIHDYVYANESLNGHKIAFIKCDIEGGEENIMEDVLHFAYNNKCKVFMSFHVSWWTSKNISNFASLFEYFDTSYSCPPVQNLCNFIRDHPFVSILFEPRENAGVLVKQNMPAVIIGYNQLTFIRNMVNQLEKYTSDISVIDNNSTFKPLLDYYQSDFKYTLLKQKRNYGHTVYGHEYIQNLVGDLYILTDPDLQFNSKLPDNFIQQLTEISNEFNVPRVGFALCIDSDDIRTDIDYNGHSIKNWEAQFWQRRISSPQKPKLELYHAPIDTTFCLINRTYSRHGPHIRVAGDFTCFHIPWHKDYHKLLEDGEYESFLENNRSSNWFKIKSEAIEKS